MLQLIGYDLSDPRSYDALESGVRACGSGINFLNGPWVLGTRQPAADVCATVMGRLRAAGSTHDKLLVLPLGSGVNGVGRTPPSRPGRPEGESDLVAIAYTLHGASPGERVPSAHYDEVQRAIERLGPWTRPLHALRFARTDLSPTGVHNHLDEEAGLYHNDELLVVELARRGRGAYAYRWPAELGDEARFLAGPEPGADQPEARWWWRWLHGIEWLGARVERVEPERVAVAS